MTVTCGHCGRTRQREQTQRSVHTRRYFCLDWAKCDATARRNRERERRRLERAAKAGAR